MKRISILWKIVLFLGVANGLTAWAHPASHPTGNDLQCKQWVDSVFAQLNPNEQLGQLIVATYSANADRQTKKSIRELAKKLRIGGFQFKGGRAEDQLSLTNLAQKEVKVPLLILPAGERLADGLPGAPVFPQDEALRCIADTALLTACKAEIAREFREMGITDSCFIPGQPAATNWPSDIIVTPTPKAELARLQEALHTGFLSPSTLEARCRRVLTYKYRLGLCRPQPQRQVSGISARINSEAAQALAARLRQEAVTVLHNYFGILPLATPEGGIAVLSIGEKEKDAPFIAALKAHAPVTSFHLATDANESACADIGKQLQPFHRLIIDITETGGYTLIGQQVAKFLTELNVQAPVVYVLFTPQTVLLTLEDALSQSNAIVLAHSAEADLQRHVADVLFAQAPAHGRLGSHVGRSFTSGTGCDIVPGMQPGRLIPEEYGMKSYILQRIGKVAQEGVNQGAYPGCHILVLKDGKAVYDQTFGTRAAGDTTAVSPNALFDLSDLTKPMATTLAIMKLYDEGKLKLEDKASAYLPLLRKTNKRDITIRDLLMNESGLAPHIRFYLEAIDPRSVHGPYAQSWKDEWHQTQISEHSYFCSDFKFKAGLMSARPTETHTLQMADGMWLNKHFKNTLLQIIAKSDLVNKRFVDSDPGFILLQQIVEQLTGLPIDRYVIQTFYEPMGLERTCFLPLQRFPATEIMPTICNDYLRHQDLCGYVQNEAAACLGGVAGNAGLFAPAGEVAKVFQMLLNGGEWNGKRLLSSGTCQLFTTQTSRTSRHGLGFDHPDASVAMRSPCSISTPASTFGYEGFTGVCAWADPKHNLVYVFLSNRLCPHAWNTTLVDQKIIQAIQELIYQSLDPH